MLRRLLSVILSIILLISALPTVYAEETPTSAVDLSSWIQKDSYREYVEMMVDHHLRTNTSVRNALAGGFCAVFLFDGCSDNLTSPVFSDLSYYRVSGVCVALQVDRQGKLLVKYFNDNCSTIPDRPLSYGAWAFEDVGEVGPATVCDGTYQLYSVRHKGNYEALHARTDYTDPTLKAVYLTPDGGFVSKRANEINIHTRTDNHILEKSMWSAGCPLVGGGEFWEFTKLMQATYYQIYEEFELDNYVGTVTIDRMMLRAELYNLYKNADAVDMFLAESRKLQPEVYLRKCTVTSADKPKTQKIAQDAQLMTLPCSNAADARSRVLAELTPGQKVTALEILENAEGKTWLKIQCQGREGYVYAPYVKDLNLFEWLLDALFG